MLESEETKKRTTFSPSFAQMTESMRFHISSLLDLQEGLKKTIDSHPSEKGPQKIQELYIDDLGRNLCRLGFLIQDIERCFDKKDTLLEIVKQNETNSPLITGGPI